MNQHNFGNTFPGQPAPQAPTPHAGGFDQSFAPPAQAFAPAAAPQGQPVTDPQGRLVGYMTPQGFVAVQQAAAAPVPAPFVPPAAATPPANAAYAQPAPVLDAAYIERMRQAAMGNGRRDIPPIGNYTFVIESTEIAMVGPEKGRKLRVFFAQITIESSDNPAIKPGHKAKFSEFLESDYDMDQAMGRFKGLCANLYGIASEPELWAQRPNWLAEVQSSPGPFVGVRGSLQVKQGIDRNKKPKFNEDGSPVKRTIVQRIG